MSRWKRKTLATAKTVSVEETDDAKGTQYKNELKDLAADEDLKKKKSFRYTDLIMKFACCGNDKTKASLLKTSDILYSLLCATYSTYSINKEKLTTATEVYKEISKEHNRLEQAIKDKHEILHDYKSQQKKMKNEKIWFKSKIAEYKMQRTILQAKEVKLQEKMDCLHDECKCDKTKLDQLTDELDVYMTNKATQLLTNLPGGRNEEQDEKEFKELLTDITDSDDNLTGSKKVPVEEEKPQTVSEPEKLKDTEPLEKEQSEKPEPVKEPETVKAADPVPPKTQKSKKKSDRKGKNKGPMPESTIQSLICEDLMTLHGCSDEEPLFPSFEADPKKKRPKTSCSKMTITSESTVSLFIPNCPCKKNSQNAISYKE